MDVFHGFEELVHYVLLVDVFEDSFFNYVVQICFHVFKTEVNVVVVGSSKKRKGYY